MRKLLRTILCAILLFCMAGTMLPVLRTEAEAAPSDAFFDEVTARIKAYMDVCDGRYWNRGLNEDQLKALKNYVDGTSIKPCNAAHDSSHSGSKCKSNTFGRARQCDGFANYVQWIAYAGAKVKKIDKDKLTKNYEFKPGDHIRYIQDNGSPHSVLVYKVVKGNTVADNLLYCVQANKVTDKMTGKKANCLISYYGESSENPEGKPITNATAYKWVTKSSNGYVKTVSYSYTVSYQANLPSGVSKSKLTGKTKASNFDVGKDVQLRANGFKLKGYSFTGWNTKADGSGKSFKNKAAVKDLTGFGKTIKLYAQWRRKYLEECTKTATYLTLTAANTKSIMSFPCNSSVTKDSTSVRNMVKGETLTATAIYKNTKNEYWYQVSAEDGKTGFVYGGYAKVKGIPEDAISGNAKLASKTPSVGKANTITGTIKSKTLKINTVKGVLTGSDGAEHTQTAKKINAKSINLEDIVVGKKLSFKTLKHGPGTLQLKVSLKGKYTDGKELISGTWSQNLKAVKFTEVGKYNIKYNPNGGNGAPQSVKKTDLKDLKLSTTVPKREGFYFAGWALKPDAKKAQFEAGAVLNVDAKDGGDLTLYAVWKVQPVSEEIQISAENFPDTAFRTYVEEKIDLSENGYLSEQEIAEVTKIECADMGIASLKGIELFTNLDYLDCCNNSLTVLDLSKNTKLTGLLCQQNALSTLDVSANRELERLNCSVNQIASLNVTGNSNLVYLYCECNKLTELNVSSCPNLRNFECFDNQITSLNLSKCSYLKKLLSTAEPKIVTVQVIYGLLDIPGVCTYELFDESTYEIFYLAVDPDVTMNPAPAHTAAVSTPDSLTADEASSLTTAAVSVMEQEDSELQDDSDSLLVEIGENEPEDETEIAAVSDEIQDEEPIPEPENYEITEAAEEEQVIIPDVTEDAESVEEQEAFDEFSPEPESGFEEIPYEEPAAEPGEVQFEEVMTEPDEIPCEEQTLETEVLPETQQAEEPGLQEEDIVLNEADGEPEYPAETEAPAEETITENTEE